MRNPIALLRVVSLVPLLALCGVGSTRQALAAPATLTVFAGAAPKPALQVLAAEYRRKCGVRVDVTYGGSGAVLTQFSQEHYGDVYVPGSDDFMDRAAARGAVVTRTRRLLAYLVPVLTVAKGNPKRGKPPR